MVPAKRNESRIRLSRSEVGMPGPFWTTQEGYGISAVNGVLSGGQVYPVAADNLPMMVRRISLALFVIVLTLTACDRGGDAATTVTSSSVPPSTTTTSEPEPSTTTTTQATTTTTEIDLSGVDLPAEALAQLEDLFAEAEEVRGLRFSSTPVILVVGPQELEARIREDIEEQSEDIPADEALYKLLGLLDPAADFETMLMDLYGEQVAGVYDPETDEVVVGARQGSLSIVEQSTMVHELVHALTDQHFDFNDDYQAMFDEDRLDQAAAYQALIEGDATLTQVMWLQGLSQSELGEFVAESLELDSTALDNAPAFLAQALMFPYDAGLGFTQALFETGGWETINEAYEVMIGLPGSSEQVITPGDYRRDLPATVDIPQLHLPGYDLERTSVWGEAGFRIMLEQVLGAETAAVASDGWGGDSYHQWFDGTNAALLLVYEGDTARDREELRQALLDFARISVPEEDFVWVDEENGLLYFIAADEPPIGELIRDTIGLT